MIENAKAVAAANEFDVDEFYGEKPLRWAQLAAVNETIRHLFNGAKRILVKMPTGCGKTITILSTMNSPMFRKAVNVQPGEKLRVLFVALKHRLLTQAERAFVDSFDIEVIFHSAFQDIPANVLAAGWHVTVLDEAQHEAAGSFQLMLESLGDMPIIGLSATPDRADGAIIKFEEIVEPISREQAVSEGYLSETELYTFVSASKRDRVQLVKDMVNAYHDVMDGTMVFMRTKKEVSEVTKFLNDSGFSAISITDQSETEVDRVLDAFSEGEYQFVVNCNKISEGVDVKRCTSVILGRTVGSYPMLNQIIGRAARPDTPCRVFEIVDPLSGYNLDTTAVVGTPAMHTLVFKQGGNWVHRNFDYNSQDTYNL